MVVWIYSTGLELNSPRFAQPGDFFTYLIFVSSIILVGSSNSTLSTLLLPHLAYLPAQTYLAEAVPEVEEDYPCGASSSIIRNINPRTACGVGMVVAD
jgi:Derlin-2/3